MNRQLPEDLASERNYLAEVHRRQAAALPAPPPITYGDGSYERYRQLFRRLGAEKVLLIVATIGVSFVGANAVPGLGGRAMDLAGITMFALVVRVGWLKWGCLTAQLLVIGGLLWLLLGPQSPVQAWASTMALWQIPLSLWLISILWRDLLQMRA